MQEIPTATTPLWLHDFLSSRRARLQEWVDEFVALDRLSLANIQPFEWGFLLRINGSERFRKWLNVRTDIRALFLLKSTELDRYANQLVLTRDAVATPAGALAAVCTWDELSQAAEYLRINCRESAARSPYGTVVLPSYIQDITNALKIPHRALNSTEIPACCETKWGVLLRLDPGSVEKTLAYLAINPSTDSAVVQVALGANCFAVAAFAGPLSPLEPVQVRLCSSWTDNLARKDANRWLKSFNPPKRKELPAP